MSQGLAIPPHPSKADSQVVFQSFAKALLRWRISTRGSLGAKGLQLQNTRGRWAAFLPLTIFFRPATLADLSVVAHAMLLAFPYHQNYVELIRLEMSAIASVKPDFIARNFAFLGSGPLPLTSLCISHHLQSECVTCHNFDQDATAIKTAVTLCGALGHSSETMCFQCASAGSPEVDLGRFDVVYMAALVGDCNRQKHEIMANVVKRMKPGALVVIRSAHSLRRLLYRKASF